MTDKQTPPDKQDSETKKRPVPLTERWESEKDDPIIIIRKPAEQKPKSDSLRSSTIDERTHRNTPPLRKSETSIPGALREAPTSKD